MAVVITRLCQDCVDGACVTVCPTDAIVEHRPQDRASELPNQLFVNPNACISCNLCLPECPWEAIYDEGPDNDFGWDMYNGSAGATITNGIRATPNYAPGHGWQSEDQGRYQLGAGTPGYDQGARIPNFTDEFKGRAPDIGAAEAG